MESIVWPETSLGRPLMLNRCKLKIVWETPLGCEPLTEDPKEELTQENHSFKVWTIVCILVASITGIVFWISLRRRNGVMGFFNGRVSYSRGFHGERAKLHSSNEWLHEL